MLIQKIGQFNPNNPAAKLGKKGGDKTMEKYGRDFYRKIGKKGAKKRWAK